MPDAIGNNRKDSRVMAEATQQPQTALKYEVEVQEGRRVELRVPFAPGARIVVFVIGAPHDVDYDQLTVQTDLDVWDLPFEEQSGNGA